MLQTLQSLCSINLCTVQRTRYCYVHHVKLSQIHTLATLSCITGPHSNGSLLWVRLPAAQHSLWHQPARAFHHLHHHYSHRRFAAVKGHPVVPNSPLCPPAALHSLWLRTKLELRGGAEGWHPQGEQLRDPEQQLYPDHPQLSADSDTISKGAPRPLGEQAVHHPQQGNAHDCWSIGGHLSVCGCHHWHPSP